MLIEPREPGDRAVRQLVRELRAELGGLDDSSGYGPRDAAEFMVGLIDGKPVACGALRRVAPGIGEINLMYVRPSWRGQGLSRLILAALEERAVELGCRLLRLESTVKVTAAARLYEAAGFHTVRGGAPDRDAYEKSLLPARAATPAGSAAVGVGRSETAPDPGGKRSLSGQCGAATASAWS